MIQTTAFKKLLSDLRTLFSFDEEHADITIIVHEKNEVRTFSAHKLILSTRNAVLKGILKDQLINNTIHIFDYSVKTFRSFIQYLYTSEINPEDITLEMFDLSHKYCDYPLQDICRVTLTNKIDVNNVVNVFLTAIRLRCDDLKEAAASFIVANYNSVKELPEFDLIYKEKEAIQAIFNNSIPQSAKSNNVNGNTLKRNKIENQVIYNKKRITNLKVYKS